MLSTYNRSGPVLRAGDGTVNQNPALLKLTV